MSSGTQSRSDNGTTSTSEGTKSSELVDILKELRAYVKKEKELDEEIKILRDALNKEPVVTDKDIMEELHKYNDMKDAAQVVIGSLARFEGVSVSELHKRYNLEMSEP